MKALVLGGAKGLHEEELQARDIGFHPDIIVATNHAGRDRPGEVHHWVSFHQELFPSWLKARRAAGEPDPLQLWTCHPAPAPISLDLPVRRAPNWKGSSGLLAVTVALEVGATHVVLAGVPLTREAEHYDRAGLWRDAGNYRKGWIENAVQMNGRVRSMSGWTANLLGMPDAEWLASERPAS